MRNTPRRPKRYLNVTGFIVVGAFIALVVLAITFFTSKHEEVITVSDKERVCSANTHDCKYLVFTENGTYENTDTLLAFKFNSSDIQGQLKPGETYTVDVWGFRQPILSWYPNILEVK